MTKKEKLLRKYPLVRERKCTDCEFYREGLCYEGYPVSKPRGTPPNLEACHLFKFRNATCSLCGKPLKNYCPHGIYVKNLRELKKFGYDGIEYFAFDHYEILCLDCSEKGVKEGKLTYGES